MPVMNGSDFIERVRDLTGKTEIIGMSAQPYVKNIFFKAGADHFVEKPIDFRRLASIVKRLHLIDGSPEE
jgi:CheY-like chemotaxis protein